MSADMPYYVVYAPIGGYGNHIRWLLLLDERYTISIDNQTLSSAVGKTEFIKQFVYPPERTFNNWLTFEFKYRVMLNIHLKFTHDMVDMFNECKMLAIKCDPDLGYRSYIKFNTNLNGLSKFDFLKQIRKQNKMCDFAESYLPTVKSIDSTKLFQPVLDKELYNSMLEFLNINNHYKQAQEIHSLWYNLHLKAETEYLNLTNL